MALIEVGLVFISVLAFLCAVFFLTNKVVWIIALLIIYACYEAINVLVNVQKMYRSPVMEMKARISKDMALEVLMKDSPVFKFIFYPFIPDDFHNHLFS